MSKSKYFISTVTGQIPNIVGEIKVESLKGDLLLYLDDFLYKDSLYDSDKFFIPLKELCLLEESTKVLLGFRNTPKTLVSKRGNYKLTHDRYEKILKIMKPDYYIDFLTREVKDFLNRETLNVKFVDPKNIDEFNALEKTSNVFLGTNFINEITKNKKMIKVDQNELKIEEVGDCTCCNGLEKGYLEYLTSLNEINGFVYLTIHNYNVLFEILK